MTTFWSRFPPTMWLLGIELRTLAHGIILPAQENTLFFLVLVLRIKSKALCMLCNNSTDRTTQYMVTSYAPDLGMVSSRVLGW